MTAALEVRDLSVRFGRLQALDGVSLDVPAGAVVGLIGPNGAGKTTLLDAVGGFVAAERGQVTLAGAALDRLPPARRAALGLGRTFQGLELFEDLTVDEHLQVAAEAAGRGGDGGSGGGPGALGLDGLGRRLPATLSTAQRRRLALARALAGRPRVLLLDEPAAGLDRAERGALAGLVRDLAGAGIGVVLADHDMALVLDVCDEVVVLDGGRVIATGSPAAVRADERVVAAYLGVAADPGPRPVADPVGRDGGGGGWALEIDRLTTGYRGVPIVRDVSLHVAPGEVVALLGANGAGKTTTLMAAAGVLPVLDGDVRVLGRPVGGGAHRVARRGMALVPQGRALFGGLTTAENLRLAARGDDAAVEAALDDLPALRPLLGRRAGLLSGGEQQMLALARGLAARPRLLLVDELSLGLAPRLVEPALAGLRALAVDRGVAVLVVEQHVGAALAAADRAYVLAAGQVVLEGPAADLARAPERLEAAYLGR